MVYDDRYQEKVTDNLRFDDEEAWVTRDLLELDDWLCLSACEMNLECIGDVPETRDSVMMDKNVGGEGRWIWDSGANHHLCANKPSSILLPKWQCMTPNLL
jgi:hypothetical protein